MVNHTSRDRWVSGDGWRPIINGSINTTRMMTVVTPQKGSKRGWQVKKKTKSISCCKTSLCLLNELLLYHTSMYMIVTFSVSNNRASFLSHSTTVRAQGKRCYNSMISYNSSSSDSCEGVECRSIANLGGCQKRAVRWYTVALQRKTNQVQHMEGVARNKNRTISTTPVALVGLISYPVMCGNFYRGTKYRDLFAPSCSTVLIVW